jgi:hypothetical protein
MSLARRFFTLLSLLLALNLVFPFTVSALENPLPTVRLDSSTVLAREPEITISSEGLVTITVALWDSCRGGEAFLGLYPQVAALGYPIYRLSGEISLENPRLFQARFDLKELETPSLDINRLKENHGGQIALRLCLQGRSPSILDRTFAYLRSNSGEYAAAPALVQGPFVNCVTDSTAIISWEFDRPQKCCFLIEPGHRALKLEATLRPEINLGGLSPNTAYTYWLTWKVDDREFSSRKAAFLTAPARGSQSDFTFAVICDGRASYGGAENDVEGVNRSVFMPLLAQAYENRAAFILMPGDLVDGPFSDPEQLDRQFRSWKRIAQPVGGSIPIYTGMGNHDQTGFWIGRRSDRNFLPLPGEGAGEVIFAKNFCNPENAPDPPFPGAPTYRKTVYSYDWGKAHFAMLNSNYFQKGSGSQVQDSAGQLEGALRPEQLAWLEKDLAAARTRGQKLIFVLAHEPAFPNGGHAKDGMWWSGKRPEILQIRDKFWKILCRYQVTATFFGDEHNYSRALIDESTNAAYHHPIWQIITGGGGAPFYDQDKSVPWAESVRAFYPLPHLCLVEVKGQDLWLRVLTPEGQIVERVNLNEK